MAFISLIFAFLFIAAVILGGIGITGLVLLVKGLSKRKDPRYFGSKSPTATAVAGGIMLAIPVAVVGTIAIVIGVSAIKTRIKRLSYTDFTDKWKNERVLPDRADDEALEYFLKAADEGDKEKIRKMFTDQLKDDERLETQLDAFLERYPKGLSEIEHESMHCHDGGDSTKTTFSGSVEIKDGDEYYTVRITACCQNDDSSQIGVTGIAVNDTAGEAEYLFEKEEHDRDYDWNGGYFIAANVGTVDKSTARRIDGVPCVFDDHGSLKRKDVIRWMRERKGNAWGFRDHFGEPNVNMTTRNSPYKSYYWELEPKDGEPQYFHLSADHYDYIDFSLCYICGSEDGSEEWFDDNGELKHEE